MSPKKRSRKAAAKTLPLPRCTPTPHKCLRDQVEVPDVIDIVMDISSRLQTTEHYVQEAEKEKSTVVTR